MAQHDPVVITIDSNDEAPAASSIRLGQLSGQTQSQAIILIDDDDEIVPAPTRNGAPRPREASVPLQTAPVCRKSPAVNRVPRASPAPATYIEGPLRQISASFEFPHPAIVPRTMASHSNRPVNGLLLGAQPQAPTRIIPPDIPLPSFHQAAIPKTRAKPVAAKKANLARRPHPQGSQGSGSPDRKRMRMNDIPLYKLPPGGPRQESDAQQQNVPPSPTPPNSQQIASASIASPKYKAILPPGVQRAEETLDSRKQPGRVVMATSKKRNCAPLIEDTIFPLATQLGKTRLKAISADVNGKTMNAAEAGNRAIYYILKAAQSLSELAKVILAQFCEGDNHTLAQAIKTKFDVSFKDLQQQHANIKITDDRTDKWISATVCDGISMCRSVENEAQPIPEPMSPRSYGTPVSTVHGILASIEEDVETIKEEMETPPKKTENYIKKHEHYRDVDILRYKGMESLERRPYVATKKLKVIELGAKNSTMESLIAKNEGLVSVPFNKEEIEAIHKTTLKWYWSPERTGKEKVRAAFGSKNGDFLAGVASFIANNITFAPRRMKEEYLDFLKELNSVSGFLSYPWDVEQSKPIALVRKRVLASSDDEMRQSYKIRMLLRRKEIAPNIERATHQLQSVVACQLDDSFARDAEFSGGPGDIASFSWLSEDDFICGAITNSDLYNQDYNKTGNLVIGTAKKKIARAVIAHRISRPPKPDKASVDSQDPWLYLSVPMTVYDVGKGLCFTASYDKSVKVWSASKDNQSMNLLATWSHNGPVNFVLTSPHHNKVATGSDVPVDGIRVYNLNRGDLNDLIPRMYSGTRANDCASRNLKWAYHPATMQWGACESASHFLLVGYSARPAIDVDHGHVPEDKRNSGQICVWDTQTRKEVHIAGPKTQNAFEVVWHPSQVVFVSATTATGDHDENVKTQLRLFVYKDSINVFSAVKTFECYGADINEITLKPSSYMAFYLTASCTNGTTYVWDSAQGDYPIHELCHNESIDQLDEKQDVEDVDAGVKFAAWGRTADRFYTGSSDGAVKMWNVRAPTGQAFINDILFAPGGISCGMFSPGRTRLAVGDTSGKIHLMKTWDKEFDPKPTYTRSAIRPFYEPVPLVFGGIDKAREFVAKAQIMVHADPYIGALQGPRYSDTNLYRHEMGRRDLETQPDEVREGQAARRQREKVVLPRLPNTNDIIVPEIQASGIYKMLLDFGLTPEEARKVAHNYSEMNLSLSSCAQLLMAGTNLGQEIPEDYVDEPEAGDVFRHRSRAGSIVSRIEKKAHYLSKSGSKFLFVI